MKMKTKPLQMVIIGLENGQRSVFAGRPLCPNDVTGQECQVEYVWFTAVHEIPCLVSLEQLTSLAMSQIGCQGHKLQ